MSRFDATALRRAREGAGITRAQFAELVGTDAEVVRLWEEKGVVPSPGRLKRAADAVGLTVDDLWRPSDETSPLAALRVRAGLGQRALARRLGVSQPLVSRIERGRVELEPELAVALAEALGETVDEVMAAANIVGPDSLAPAVGPREPISPGPATPVTAHLVCVVRWEGLSDLPAEPVAPPPWGRVYAPQGVDIAARGDLGGMLDEAAAVLLRRGYTAFRTHYEAQVVIDDETVCTLRAQVQPKSDTRLKILKALFVGLGPGQIPDAPPIPEAVKKEWRDQWRAGLPEAKWGERLLIVAEPEDTLQWLREQAWPDKPCAAVLPAPGSPPWAVVGVHGARVEAVRGPRSSGVLELAPDEPAVLGDLVARIVGT